jgi:hypothetical protein
MKVRTYSWCWFVPRDRAYPTTLHTMSRLFMIMLTVGLVELKLLKLCL